MTLQLRCVEGALAGEPIEIGSELVLGRGLPGASGLGGDVRLSRQHARLYRSGSDLLLEDLGSTNGTWVNDNRIVTQVALRDGDLVRCGRTVLQAFVTEPASRAPDHEPETEPEQTFVPDRGRRRVGDTAPGPRLQVVAGPLDGQTLALGPLLQIGRAYSGDGSLGGDQRVSRHHARIARGAGGVYYVEDTGSTNGTTVNGVTVRAPRALGDGDEIGIGATRLVVHGVPQTPAIADDDELDDDRASAGATLPPRADSPREPDQDPSAERGASLPARGFHDFRRGPSVRRASPFGPGVPAAATGAGAGAVALAAPGFSGFVPQGEARSRLGKRRLVFVFVGIFAVSVAAALVAIRLSAPPKSRACPNGFVCQPPPTAPPLHAQQTFTGALGWRAEYAPSLLRVIKSDRAGNELVLTESNAFDEHSGLAQGSEIIAVEVRGFRAADESAASAMQSVAGQLTSHLVGPTTAPNSDQIFPKPAVGFHPGVGEVMEGSARTPQGPGGLVKVVALAATDGGVTVAVGVIYGVQQASSQQSNPDKPLDQLGDSVIETIRFPADGQT